MKKVLLAVLGILLINWLFFSYKAHIFQKKPQSNKITVITTLFPLYDFAKNIGGNNASVSLLLPPGVEPHSFDPKPKDIVAIGQADIFVYTGKFMEPWVEDILKGAGNRNLIVVDSSVGVQFIPKDPHIWLDPQNAQIMIKNITKAFIEKDPSRKEEYTKNSKKLISELAHIDKEYSKQLSKCVSKEIIYGGHFALGYLTKRYGLTYSATQGISPDAEPTVQDLTMLVDQINKNSIKYVFYEELTSPKIAETLAKETGAKLLFLNAGHNISSNELKKSVSYTSILRENLTNLTIGLECTK